MITFSLKYILSDCWLKGIRQGCKVVALYNYYAWYVDDMASVRCVCVYERCLETCYSLAKFEIKHGMRTPERTSVCLFLWSSF